MTFLWAQLQDLRRGARALMCNSAQSPSRASSPQLLRYCLCVAAGGLRLEVVANIVALHHLFQEFVNFTHLAAEVAFIFHFPDCPKNLHGLLKNISIASSSEWPRRRYSRQVSIMFV